MHTVVRPQRRRARGVRRPWGWQNDVDRLARGGRRPTRSGWSTSARPTTSTPSRRSPPWRPASTSPARSRWPARSPTPRRWPTPPPRRRARPSSGSTTAGCRRSRWPTGSSPTGALGRIYHVRAAYLQSWGGPDTPLLWRFQGDVAGSGAHGDLNAHIIDMVRFVTGEEIVTIEGADRAHLHQASARVIEGSAGGEIAGAGAQHRRRQGPQHGRRRRAVPRPHERRGARQLRGHPPRHRLPQRQPLRDPRRARGAPLRLRADERARLLRRHDGDAAAAGLDDRSTSPAAATATRTPRPGGPTATASATSTASSTRPPTS